MTAPFLTVLCWFWVLIMSQWFSWIVQKAVLIFALMLCQCLIVHKAVAPEKKKKEFSPCYATAFQHTVLPFHMLLLAIQTPYKSATFLVFCFAQVCSERATFLQQRGPLSMTGTLKKNMGGGGEHWSLQFENSVKLFLGVAYERYILLRLTIHMAYLYECRQAFYNIFCKITMQTLFECDFMFLLMLRSLVSQ